MSARRIGWSIFAVLALVVVLASTASLWAPKLASEKPEPTPEATQGAETAPPADTRNGFAQPNPDGPQAVEQPTKPTYAQQSIAPLPAQHPDRTVKTPRRWLRLSSRSITRGPQSPTTAGRKPPGRG